jgi:hypothetical protein
MLALLLDIEGAFDNVFYRKMISRIIDANIEGQFLAFLRDYLHNRKVKARVGGVALSCFGVLIELTLIVSFPYVDQLRQLYLINIYGGFICF